MRAIGLVLDIDQANVLKRIEVAHRKLDTKKERRPLLSAVYRLLDEGVFDVKQFIDGRDLSRFGEVSAQERRVLENLEAGEVPINANGQRPRYRTLRGLKYNFGVASPDHLALLFRAYKQTDFDETNAVRKNAIQEELETPIIGEILTEKQGQIFLYEAQGQRMKAIRRLVGLKRVACDEVVKSAYSNLGLEKRSEGNISIVNKLIENGEVDVAQIARGHDLTLFDRLSATQMFVLNRMVVNTGNSFIAKDYVTTSKDPQKAVDRVAVSIMKRIGSLTRIHTAVLFRAYQGILAQGYEPPERTRNEVAVRLVEHSAKGIGLESLGGNREKKRAYDSLSELYRVKGVSDIREAFLSLISTGELDLKELGEGFKLANFDRLTAGELAVCDLMVRGVIMKNNEIGKSLGLSQRRVESLAQALYAKIGTTSLEQLTAMHLLYQYPRGFKEAAKQFTEPDDLDVVGVQALRLSLKGLGEKEIIDTLKITSEQLSGHLKQVFVALGTGGNIESLMKLYKMGRIEARDVTNGYDIGDFATLEKEEIGVLEALVCEDPRPYLSHIEKMTHYLRMSREEVLQRLKEVKYDMGIQSTQKLAVLYLEYRRRKENGLPLS